jgi:hypothetical protein
VTRRPSEPEGTAPAAGTRAARWSAKPRRSRPTVRLVCVDHAVGVEVTAIRVRWELVDVVRSEPVGDETLLALPDTVRPDVEAHHDGRDDAHHQDHGYRPTPHGQRSPVTTISSRHTTSSSGCASMNSSSVIQLWALTGWL